MRLFDAVQKQETAPVTWCLFAELDGQKLEFSVRSIPAPDERRINRHYGGRQKLTHTKHGPVSTQDPDKAEGWVYDRAALALVDSRNVEVRIVDEESARLYSEALGAPVKAGDLVKLDGRWTEAVKAQVFRDMTALAIWLSDKAGTLRAVSAQEEDGKDEA